MAMNKKRRFSLEMSSGVMVHTLEELRDNFNIEKIIEHVINGKLITWLKDRYYENEALQIENLDRNDTNFDKKLCEILDVKYFKDKGADIETIEIRNLKLKKLKQITDDEEVIKNIKRVAFNQEELADLLDEDERTIYLCGKRFTLPLSKENITYIGVSKPTITINSRENIDLDEKNIIIKDCILKCDSQINIIASKSKELTLETSIEQNNKFVNFKHSNYWTVSLKERKIYEESTKDPLLIHVINTLGLVDNNGKKFINRRSLFRNNTNDNEELIIEESSDVLDFCVSSDIIFYSLSYGLDQGIIYKINIDGDNKESLNIQYKAGSIKTGQKSIFCNENYVIWSDNDRYNSCIFKSEHDGKNKEKVVSLFNSYIRICKVIGDYILYISGKDDYLYRIDLQSNSTIQIDDNVRKLDTDGKSLYYLKWERTGWGEYKNDSQNCFYKTNLDGKEKLLLGHHYPFDAITELKYKHNSLYYYTKKTLAGILLDNSSPEIEHKIIIDK